MELRSKSFLKLFILFILTFFIFSLKVDLAEAPVLKKLEEGDVEESQGSKESLPQVLTRPRRPLPEDISSVKVSRDLDKNKIEDLLDELIEKTTEPEKEEKILVLLNVPFDESHLDEFRFLGGRIKHTYRYATKGFSGTMRIGQLKALANRLGPHLKIVKKAKPIIMHLDKSVRIIRARDAAWTYGYTGDLNNPVAILDTGIDDSHIDLSGKVTAWHDTTDDNSTSPEDYQAHGSHVASTVAGTGEALLGSTPISTLTLSFTGTYPTTKGYGYVDMIELPSTGTVTLNMYHGQGARNTWLDLRYPDIDYSLGSISGTDDPLIGSWDVTSTGTYFTISGQDAPQLTGDPYSTLETFPYSQVGDGYNLFTGVAPDANLVGVKIFNNTGIGYDTNMYAAFDWIIANKETFSIKVASMSAGLGAEDTDLRAAANQVVENGIVFSISAGNDYPDATVKDPALASKIICVGATNDDDQMTDYSSNASAGSSKPDAVAPGGSFQIGSQITAVDTNDCDGHTVGFADRQDDDYTNMGGTSMSCPHVAGLAALIIQALEADGYTWNYTEADALKVKMLILMTAVETNREGEDPDGTGGTPPNTPPLNRGSKDLIEGYGRINADAAIEAVTTEHTGSTEYDTLCPSSSLDKKVWARKVNMPGGEEITFNLDIPYDADYDLYLYRGTPAPNGDPVILASSTSQSTGNPETVTYTASGSETDYIVVKRVSGSGNFSLSSNLVPTPMIDVDIYEDSLRTQEDKFFDNADIIYIQANATLEGGPLTGATVTATLKVNDGATTETSFVLDELGSGIYQKAWDSTGHTNDVYLVEVTTDYSPPGSGKIYFHLYPGSGVSAYRLDYDEDGNDDYILENKHLIAVYDGRTDTDKLLLCLRQKDTDLNYTFGEISDTDSKGTGEVTTTNMKELRFHSLAFSESGEDLFNSSIKINAEVVDPLPPVSFLTESFETSVPPSGWSEENNVPGSEDWKKGSFGNPAPPDGSYAAIVEYDAQRAQDAWLITPTLNLSGYENCELKFYIYYMSSGWDEHLYVKVSTDGGSSWPNTLADYYQEAHQNNEQTLSLSAFDGESNVKIAFQLYTDAPDAGDSVGIDLVRVNCTPAATVTSFDLDIQMNSGSADYLVYKLSGFDEYIDDINGIFSPISGSLGSSIEDDRYHTGDGEDEPVNYLTPGSWTNFAALTDPQKYVAIYDSSYYSDPAYGDIADDNVMGWVYFPHASTVSFKDVGLWYETGKEALRIRYDTTSAGVSNQAEYILVFTKGSYSVIDMWMSEIASGRYPPVNFMTPPLYSVDIPLQAGWNLIALPVTPSTPYTASSLIEDINNQGGTAQEVDRWDNGAWNGYMPELPAEPPFDFDIEVDKGYFVRYISSSTWTVTGTKLNITSIPLNAGWTLISLPNPGYSANTLMDDINSQGGTAQEVDRWDNGAWNGYVPELPPVPPYDFDIEVGKGYFVRCDSEGSFNPQ